MKRTLAGFAAAVLVAGMAGSVGATPITFDVADGSGGSSVTVSESARWGDLEGALATDLGAQTFVLADGESMTIDFFTLTASGIAVGADYTVEATLAFDVPDIEAQGTGVGNYFTFFGVISGGTLTWGDTSPDTFVMPDGTSLSIAFEEGSAIFLCDPVMIQATVTNQGGGTGPTTSVPEPGTLLLLGSGMVGLAVCRRMKAKKF